MGESKTTHRTTPIPDDVPVTTDPSRQTLTDTQLADYRTHRETLLTWLATAGKHPDQGEGYPQASLRNTAYRLDQFYRWLWDRERYTVAITHDHADTYLEWLADQSLSPANKTKIRMALQRLFTWQVHERGADPWDPQLSFSAGSGATNPRDHLTRTERTTIREAALEYGSIPGYSDLTPQAVEAVSESTPGETPR